jgi:biopolymer transport protein TolR
MLASGGDKGAGSIYRGLRSRRGGDAMLGEINVTPLVDVVLVLLLVFMVTAPMMSRGIDVSLPTADQPQIPQEDRITVSLNAEGRVYVGDQPVNLLLLEDKIRALTGGRPESVVYLRADEGLRYGQVIQVVDVVKRAGVLRIGFVYALPEEKRPEEKRPEERRP